MNAIIQQYGLNANSEYEIDYKYEMMYKNFLLNNDGLVAIGSELTQFTPTEINIFSSLNHFNDFKIGRSKPDRTLQLKKQTSYSYNNRATEASCVCRSTFDKGAGLKCQDRRLKGCLDIEFYSYNEENTYCNVEYDMEASSCFYKKVFGVWWKYKADNISVTADFSIINRRGGIENNICFLGAQSNSKTNSSSVSVVRNLFCEAILFAGDNCLDERGNHDINSGDSSHSATKAGECNGMASCAITNCIN